MDVIFRAQPVKTVSYNEVKEKLLALSRDQKYKVKIFVWCEKERNLGEIFLDKELNEIEQKLEKLRQQNIELLDKIERSLHEELIKSYQNQLNALKNGFSLKFEDSEIVLTKKIWK